MLTLTNVIMTQSSYAIASPSPFPSPSQCTKSSRHYFWWRLNSDFGTFAVKERFRTDPWKCHDLPLPWDLLARPSYYLLHAVLVPPSRCSHHVTPYAQELCTTGRRCTGFFGGVKCFRPVFPPSRRLLAFLVKWPSLKILYSTWCRVPSST